MRFSGIVNCGPAPLINRARGRTRGLFYVQCSNGQVTELPKNERDWRSFDPTQLRNSKLAKLSLTAEPSFNPSVRTRPATIVSFAATL